jgi:hypothetical protein
LATAECNSKPKNSEVMMGIAASSQYTPKGLAVAYLLRVASALALSAESARWRLYPVLLDVSSPGRSRMSMGWTHTELLFGA